MRVYMYVCVCVPSFLECRGWDATSASNFAASSTRFFSSACYFGEGSLTTPHGMPQFLNPTHDPSPSVDQSPPNPCLPRPRRIVDGRKEERKKRRKGEKEGRNRRKEPKERGIARVSEEVGKKKDGREEGRKNRSKGGKKDEWKEERKEGRKEGETEGWKEEGGKGGGIVGPKKN